MKYKLIKIPIIFTLLTSMLFNNILFANVLTVNVDFENSKTYKDSRNFNDKYNTISNTCSTKGYSSYLPELQVDLASTPYSINTLNKNDLFQVTSNTDFSSTKSFYMTKSLSSLTGGNIDVTGDNLQYSNYDMYNNILNQVVKVLQDSLSTYVGTSGIDNSCQTIITNTSMTNANIVIKQGENQLSQLDKIGYKPEIVNSATNLDNKLKNEIKFQLDTIPVGDNCQSGECKKENQYIYQEGPSTESSKTNFGYGDNRGTWAIFTPMPDCKVHHSETKQVFHLKTCGGESICSGSGLFETCTSSPTYPCNYYLTEWDYDVKYWAFSSNLKLCPTSNAWKNTISCPPNDSEGRGRGVPDPAEYGYINNGGGVDPVIGYDGNGKYPILFDRDNIDTKITDDNAHICTGINAKNSSADLNNYVLPADNAKAIGSEYFSDILKLLNTNIKVPREVGVYNNNCITNPPNLNYQHLNPLSYNPDYYSYGSYLNDVLYSKNNNYTITYNSLLNETTTNITAPAFALNDVNIINVNDNEKYRYSSSYFSNQVIGQIDSSIFSKIKVGNKNLKEKITFIIPNIKTINNNKLPLNEFNVILNYSYLLNFQISGNTWASYPRKLNVKSTIHCDINKATCENEPSLEYTLTEFNSNTSQTFDCGGTTDLKECFCKNNKDNSICLTNTEDKCTGLTGDALTKCSSNSTCPVERQIIIEPCTPKATDGQTCCKDKPDAPGCPVCAVKSKITPSVCCDGKGITADCPAPCNKPSTITAGYCCDAYASQGYNLFNPVTGNCEKPQTNSAKLLCTDLANEEAATKAGILNAYHEYIKTKAYDLNAVWETGAGQDKICNFCYVSAQTDTVDKFLNVLLTPYSGHLNAQGGTCAVGQYKSNTVNNNVDVSCVSNSNNNFEFRLSPLNKTSDYSIKGCTYTSTAVSIFTPVDYSQCKNFFEQDENNKFFNKFIIYEAPADNPKNNYKQIEGSCGAGQVNAAYNNVNIPSDFYYHQVDINSINDTTPLQEIINKFTSQCCYALPTSYSCSSVSTTENCSGGQHYDPAQANAEIGGTTGRSFAGTCCTPNANTCAGINLVTPCQSGMVLYNNTSTIEQAISSIAVLMDKTCYDGKDFISCCCRNQGPSVLIPSGGDSQSTGGGTTTPNGTQPTGVTLTGDTGTLGK